MPDIYNLLTHVTHCATIPNQPLKNNLQPLSTWPVTWWKKAACISSDIPTFIYVKIKEIKSIPLVHCLLQLHIIITYSLEILMF